MIGGVAYGETVAKALGIPYVMGVAEGISRARYFPGVEDVKVKLLAEPGTLRLIGAQMVGREGIKERADFLAMAVKTGITLEDLAFMENVYSPPIGALNEPIALAAQNALAGWRPEQRALRGLAARELRALPARRRAARRGRARRPFEAPAAAADAQGLVLPRRLRADLPAPAVALPQGSSSSACRAATARRGRREQRQPLGPAV